MRECYELRPLDDLAELHMGATPARIEPSYWADGQTGAPWVAISDIKSKFVDATSETITSEGIRAARLRQVEPGTPIMSFKLSLGRATIPTVPVFTNEAIVALKARTGKSHARWLYHAVPAIARGAVAETAIKGKTLNLDKLKTLRIPTPTTLAEQRRIAEVLDEVDSQIATYRQLMAKRRAVREALTSAFFRSRDRETTSSGNYVTCGDAFTLSGGSPQSQAEPNIGGDTPIYGSSGLAGYGRRALSTGPTVVIGRVGEGGVGSVRYVSQPAWITDNALWMDRLHTDWNAEFVALYLDWFDLRQLRSQTGQPLITQGAVAAVPLPRLSRTEQRHFVEVIRSGLEEEDRSSVMVSKLRQVQQALMDDLLTGRVRVPVGGGV